MGLDAGYTWFPSPAKDPGVRARNLLGDISLIGSGSQHWRVLQLSLNKKRPVSHIFPTATITLVVISGAAGTGETHAGHLGGVL